MQRTVIELISDISGEEASETVTFGFEGVEYEIDLTDAEASGLREALQPFAGAGRRVGGRRTTRNTAGSRAAGSGSAGGAAGREERAAIRAWANQQGLPVPERGRIPATTVLAFQAAAH